MRKLRLRKRQYQCHISSWTLEAEPEEVVCQPHWLSDSGNVVKARVTASDRLLRSLISGSEAVQLGSVSLTDFP